MTQRQISSDWRGTSLMPELCSTLHMVPEQSMPPSFGSLRLGTGLLWRSGLLGRRLARLRGRLAGCRRTQAESSAQREDDGGGFRHAPCSVAWRGAGVQIESELRA